jgi:hypothetical protein
MLFRLKRDTARLLKRAVEDLPHEERYGAKSKIADEAITKHLAARNGTDPPPNK